MSHSNPDTDDERFVSITRKPRKPPDSVRAAEIGDGVVIYDREDHDAWISSSTFVDIRDTC
jgi:hypothetical protein